MGKMKALAMDMEEMFFEAANDVVLECESFEDFYDLMRPQLDLVKHMDIQEVVNILNGIWNDSWGDFIEYA